MPARIKRVTTKQARSGASRIVRLKGTAKDRSFLVRSRPEKLPTNRGLLRGDLLEVGIENRYGQSGIYAGPKSLKEDIATIEKEIQKRPELHKEHAQYRKQIRDAQFLGKADVRKLLHESIGLRLSLQFSAVRAAIVYPEFRKAISKKRLDHHEYESIAKSFLRKRKALKLEEIEPISVHNLGNILRASGW